MRRYPPAVDALLQFWRDFDIYCMQLVEPNEGEFKISTRPHLLPTPHGFFLLQAGRQAGRPRFNSPHDLQSMVKFPNLWDIGLCATAHPTRRHHIAAC